jgi:ribose transport system permease protein
MLTDDHQIGTVMSASDATDTASAPRAGIGQVLSRLGLAGIVIAFMIAMSFLSPVFLSLGNFRNLLIQSAILAVLALGQTLVIMVRGIDLSIGGIMALSSSLAVGLMGANVLPGPLAIPFALVIGALAGLVSGLAVTKLGITPLIVTLAMLSVTRGAVFVYTDGANFTVQSDAIIALAETKLLGLPLSVWLLALLALIVHLVLSRTVFGRGLYATGGNETAARLAGIPTARVATLAYVVSGLMAAIAGLILSGRLETAGPRAGQGIELTVIAACVIGGTSLFGGQGNVIGTLLGVALITLVGNAINLLGVPPAWDELVKGLVIFFAAFIDIVRRRYSASAVQVRGKT